MTEPKTIVTIEFNVDPTEEQMATLKALIGTDIDVGGKPMRILDVYQVDDE